jgi:hypothetical protein
MNPREQILSAIIDDAKAKGASILGWNYSANGKIIILKQGDIPLYCINLLQAIDLLIHQYNLMKKYAYVYTQNRTAAQFGLSNPNETSEKAHTVEEKAIQLCNAIILNPIQPFNIEAQNKIYHAIYRASGGKQLDQDDFLILRGKLSDHYNNLYLSSSNAKEKENLRKVNRFLEKMKYKDFMELF